MISILQSILAQSVPVKPFINPLDLHDHWWLTLIPLAFFISMAYKAVRIPAVDRFWTVYWKQVLIMTLQIVGGMVLLSIAAYLIVELIVPMLT